MLGPGDDSFEIVWDFIIGSLSGKVTAIPACVVESGKGQGLEDAVIIDRGREHKDGYPWAC